MANALDKNGVKNIYFTKQGGREWYLGDVPAYDDPELVLSGSITNMTMDTNGYWIPDDPTAGRISIQVKEYVSAPVDVSHAAATARGWLSTPYDWGPIVEFTAFFNLTKIIPNTERLQMMGPTGDHPSDVPMDCSGASYGVAMAFYKNPAVVEIYKEVYHDYSFSLPDRTVPSFEFEFNKGTDIGSKYIVFLQYGPERKYVKIEHWMNGNGDKITWIKVNEYTDTGGFGTGSEACHGDPNNILNFRNGRMRMWWNCDETDIKFKYVSVREVTNNPIEIPVQPPVVNPPPAQQGAFRRTYSIIYDMGTFEGDECGFEEPPPEEVQTKEIYNVSQNSTDRTPLNEGIHRQSIHMQTAASVLIGERPVEVTWKLGDKHGSPDSTKPITSHIRRGTDDAIVATFDYVGGTLTPDLLSTETFDPYTFRNMSANYALQYDDYVTVEWTGGTSTDWIEVAENTTDPFDGGNTCKVKYDSGGPPPTSWGSSQSSRDLAAQIKARA
jgi:hypothetical protein